MFSRRCKTEGCARPPFLGRLCKLCAITSDTNPWKRA